MITQTPLVFIFTAHRSDYNLFDDSLYVSSGFKCLEVTFLQKLKNKQKMNWIMNENEKLHALQVLDGFMSGDDEECDEKDSQLWSNYSNIAVFCFSSASKRF